MAGKDYGLYAYVGIYDKDPAIPTPVSHYTLEIEKLGIRKGQEVGADEIYQNGLGMMGAMFKAMKTPGLMSLVWEPPDGQKMLFTGIKRKKLQIEIDFVRSGNHTFRAKSSVLMTFDNVHIKSVAPERHGVKGAERIDVAFTKFEC